MTPKPPSQSTRASDEHGSGALAGGPTPPHEAGRVLIDTRAALRDTCLAIARGAGHELLLFEHILDPDLYGADFIDALRRLALARTGLCIRILLADPDASRQRHHQLVDLADRLTSRIAIRRLGEESSQREDAYLIGDRHAYVRRTLASSQQAIADRSGRREAHRLGLDFDALWEHGEVDCAFRRLHL